MTLVKPPRPLERGFSGTLFWKGTAFSRAGSYAMSIAALAAEVTSIPARVEPSF
jgi:hypothetical protein